MKLLPLALLPLLAGLALPVQAAGNLQWRKTKCDVYTLGEKVEVLTIPCVAGFSYDTVIRATKLQFPHGNYYLEVGQNAKFHPLVGDDEFDYTYCLLTSTRSHNYMVCTTQDQNQLGIVGD